MISPHRGEDDGDDNNNGENEPPGSPEPTENLPEKDPKRDRGEKRNTDKLSGSVASDLENKELSSDVDTNKDPDRPCTEDSLGEWLDANVGLVETWLQTRAKPEVIEKLYGVLNRRQDGKETEAEKTLKHKQSMVIIKKTDDDGEGGKEEMKPGAIDGWKNKRKSEKGTQNESTNEGKAIRSEEISQREVIKVDKEVINKTKTAKTTEETDGNCIKINVTKLKYQKRVSQDVLDEEEVKEESKGQESTVDETIKVVRIGEVPRATRETKEDTIPPKTSENEGNQATYEAQTKEETTAAKIVENDGNQAKHKAITEELNEQTPNQATLKVQTKEDTILSKISENEGNQATYEAQTKEDTTAAKIVKNEGNQAKHKAQTKEDTTPAKIVKNEGNQAKHKATTEELNEQTPQQPTEAIKPKCPILQTSPSIVTSDYSDIIPEPKDSPKIIMSHPSKESINKICRKYSRFSTSSEDNEDPEKPSTTSSSEKLTLMQKLSLEKMPTFEIDYSARGERFELFPPTTSRRTSINSELFRSSDLLAEPGANSSRRTSVASCYLSQFQLPTNAPTISTSRRTSVASDIFQTLVTSSSPVKSTALTSFNYPGRTNDLNMLNESDLFIELIKDVANELDIDVLCHKILVNVQILTNADRGSLFLVHGSSDDQFLIAKLYDVARETELEEAVRKASTDELRIPFGVGIAGTVAKTKETINIANAQEDARFNAIVDTRAGYETNLILCMPICNHDGDVIGVAQIVNKRDDGKEFTQRDVEIFERYLTFCGIGIHNAQLFEVSVIEYKRNQILLNLARSIFEEQSNLECLVTKIMREAQELLKCDRCAVYLLDLNCCEANHLEKIIEKPAKEKIDEKPSIRQEYANVCVEDLLAIRREKGLVFTTLFELRDTASDVKVSRPAASDLQNSTLAQIASYIAKTGQILNIADVHTWLQSLESDINDASDVQTILCMPIINAQKNVIGVAQLINKENDALFTECDISLFEAFAIFCGLGIHNTQMYENACKLMAKQKVALECLSYHATASNEATIKLIHDDIPPAETFNLYSYEFIDFDLTDSDTCKAAIRMFLQLNLVQQFHIPYDVLCRWILSIKKNYRPVKYHNWRHALNVAQTMFVMMKTGKMERFMTDLEILGLLVACLCHDLDHRGTNNAFQLKSDSPLAILYTTSTMEHHHFDQCVMILNSDCNNIFQALSPDDYKNVMKIVETAILSTDLAMYFKKRSKFMEVIENGEFDWQSEEKKELLCGMMMTACDVSAIAKPWEVQHKVAKLVADEFFDQGDLERMQLNEEPIAMMDRERQDELPQMQVGFIDCICLPLYRVLAETFPWVEPLYRGTMENRRNWQDLAEKVEMGLTWIDHDTIDEPIEALAETEAVKELEFTVTTLHQESIPDRLEPKPWPRERLQSLKGRTLGRIVRNRLTSSMYISNPKRTKCERTSQLEEVEPKSPVKRAEVLEVLTVPVVPLVKSEVFKAKKPKRRMRLCVLL